MENDPQKPEKFSSDPEEQLRIENEILKLKLKAETGSGVENPQNNIDPALENAFLKNVIEFERQFAKAKPTTVYELTGKPDFPKASTLDDDQILETLENLTHILEEHQIEVDFLGDYPEREKYRFITEELFQYESDDMFIPGMIQHFIYEEFHPNHPLTITDRVTDFIGSWFRQQLSEESMELSDQWITEKGEIYSKEHLLQKIQYIFDSYGRFENTKYELQKVQADVKEGEKTGKGFAEGMVKYDAVMENKEIMHFEGPFKIYLELIDNWWSIFFANWPGLNL